MGMLAGLDPQDRMLAAMSAFTGAFQGRDGFGEGLQVAAKLSERNREEVQQQHSAGMLSALLGGETDYQGLAARYRHANPQVLSGMLSDVWRQKEQLAAEGRREDAQVREEGRRRGAETDKAAKTVEAYRMLKAAMQDQPTQGPPNMVPMAPGPAPDVSMSGEDPALLPPGMLQAVPPAPAPGRPWDQITPTDVPGADPAGMFAAMNQIGSERSHAATIANLATDNQLQVDTAAAAKQQKATEAKISAATSKAARFHRQHPNATDAQFDKALGPDANLVDWSKIYPKDAANPPQTPAEAKALSKAREEGVLEANPNKGQRASSSAAKLGKELGADLGELGRLTGTKFSLDAGGTYTDAQQQKTMKILGSMKITPERKRALLDHLDTLGFFDARAGGKTAP